MAHFEEHCKDCERILGDRHEDVNHWIDDCFKRFGPLHRFMRHHMLGVEEARQQFGDEGGCAAIIHILKDCGHVPTKREWAEQKVDSLGIIIGDRFNGYWDPAAFDRAAKAEVEAYKIRLTTDKNSATVGKQ